MAFTMKLNHKVLLLIGAEPHEADENRWSENHFRNLLAASLGLALIASS